MSLNIIGKENLPNVYIKEVSIDATRETKTFTVEKRGVVETIEQQSNRLLISPLVYLKDIKDGNSRFQWYENELLRKNMKIMIVISHSEQFNSSVESGNYSFGFIPKHLQAIPGYGRDKVEYKLISIQNINKDLMAKSAEIVEGGILYTFGFRSKFNIKNSPNVSVFATCVLDTRQFSLEEDLDLSYKNIESFHGAVVGEKVLEQYKIPTKTNLFFNGEDLWTGPTHKHVNKYMAGSKHSSVPHPILNLKEIQNTKIKDYRFHKSRKSNRKSKIKTKKSPFITPLYDSCNSKGNFQATFSLDMKKLFIQNTKFGYLLSQLNDDLFNLMLSKISIIDLKIEREAILVSNITGRMGTTKPVARRIINKRPIISSKDSSPYIFKTKYRYFNSKTSRDRQLSRNTPLSPGRTKSGQETLKSSIKEIFSLSREMRTFVFTDLDASYKTSGHYRYIISVKIKDPTNDYIKEMLRELKTGFIKFGLYKNKVEKKANYDYNLEKTKNDFVLRTKDSAWTEFLNTYLKFFDLLFAGSRQGRSGFESMGPQLVSLLNPRSATVKSLQVFQIEYQYLLNYFMTYFKFNDKMFNEPNTRGNVKVNPDKGKILLVHRFPKIFSFNGNKCRISFLPIRARSSTGEFPFLSRGNFKVMGEREKRKFFRGNPKFTSKQAPLFNKDALSSLNKIENNICTYFSPRAINVEEDSFDVSNLEKIDIFGFNKFYDRFVNKGVRKKDSKNSLQNRRRTEIANRQRSSFFIKKKPPTPLKSHEVRQKVTDVLGKNTNMGKAKKQHSKIQNKVLDSKIKKMFNSFESNIEAGERRNKKEFLLNHQNNIFYSLAKSKKFNKEKLEKIPLQIKALMGSGYNFSRTNLLSSKLDLLSSPLTKDLVNLLFFTIIKIEYLDGYRTGAKGESNLKHPIWKTLTRQATHSGGVGNKPTLCRATFYSNPVLKVAKSPLDSFNIEDQYFFIGPRTWASGRGAFNHLVKQRWERDGQKENKLLSDLYGSFQEANVVPIEYAQSILINQTNNKNGPLRSVDYSIKKKQELTPLPPSIPKKQPREQKLKPPPGAKTITKGDRNVY